MKKILILAVSILSGSLLMAAPAVWLSSNTQTADIAQNLCPSKTGTLGSWGGRGIFHGLCVNTGAAGSLNVWTSSSGATSAFASSTFTVTNTAAVIPCEFFDVTLSSGLYYSNTATANVTLLYSCY